MRLPRFQIAEATPKSTRAENGHQRFAPFTCKRAALPGYCVDPCLQSRMNNQGKLLVLMACAGLSACALISSPADPAANKVSVNGEHYLLSQITAGTWTVSTTGMARKLPGNPASRIALLQAVEEMSGCKVTDSDYSRQGKQLDAQVACDSRLEN